MEGSNYFLIEGPRWWREPESNRRHTDFQSVALPTELSRPAKRKQSLLDCVYLSTREEDGPFLLFKVGPYCLRALLAREDADNFFFR